MAIREICNREVVIIHRSDTVLDAAKLMRQHHVGDVVVVDERDGMRIPVGIITDRDLVVEVMAAEADRVALRVGELMTTELAVVKENTGVFEAIQYMRGKGVRRLPVINDSGGLVGILTLDDLLELLSEELTDLSKLVRHEQQKESVVRH